jgi:hypothetical protein
MTIDAVAGFKHSGLQYKNPFNKERRSVDHHHMSSPGTADERHTPRIRSKKGNGSKFE